MTYISPYSLNINIKPFILIYLKGKGRELIIYISRAYQLENSTRGLNLEVLLNIEKLATK